jgi:hypothetical protein
MYPGPFFYIHITITFIQAIFTFLQTNIFYHMIRLILCFEQTGEIDNLTTSWGKVSGLYCVQVPHCLLAPHKAPCKVSYQQPSGIASFSYRSINFGFITKGKHTAMLFTPSSWGSQLVRQHRRINKFCGAVAGD